MIEIEKMKLVVIESPLSGDFGRNLIYAKLCMLDSLRRGEAPFASHLLYTQVLDDTDPESRDRGMTAGFAWGKKCDLRAFYMDRGMSGGMLRAYTMCQGCGEQFVFRYLPADLLDVFKNRRVISATPGVNNV